MRVQRMRFKDSCPVSLPSNPLAEAAMEIISEHSADSSRRHDALVQQPKNLPCTEALVHSYW